MIYVIEGADGTGKTTLARAIADETSGHILHCTWKKEWDMKGYFTEVLRAAKSLAHYQDVVIDRWAPSELVYGSVFRGGPSFDVYGYLWEEGIDTQLKFIYCRNDNVIENHLKNKEQRIEMFQNIAGVQEEFDTAIKATDFLEWTTYDYDKVKLEDFIKEVLPTPTTPIIEEEHER